MEASGLPARLLDDHDDGDPTEAEPACAASSGTETSPLPRGEMVPAPSVALSRRHVLEVTRRPHRWRWIVIVRILAEVVLVGVAALSLPAAIAYVVTTWLSHGYPRRYHLSVLNEGAYSPAALCATLAALLTRDIPLWWGLWLFWLILVAGLAAASISAVVGKQIRQRYPRPTVIIGTGELGRTLATTLGAHPEYGLAVVGFVSDVPTDGVSAPVIPFNRADIEVDRASVTDVICAFGPESDADLVPLLRRLQRLEIRLALIPRLFDMSPVGDHIWGIPVLPLPTALPFRPGALLAKRMLELVVTSAVLLAASPVMLACAIAIKLTSKGPVFYSQTRITGDGAEFRILKFRTMRVGADTEPNAWTVADDPRRTKVGAFLRRTGIDELPQLFNILRGDMALIGPRPEQASFAAQFSDDIPTFDDRHRVASGLTGLAQVHGLRGDTSIEERARFDNRYIDRHSLLLDLRLIIKTIGAILKGHGAY